MIGCAKKISRAICVASLLLLNISPAWADTRSDLQSWLQSDSKTWLSNYVWDSIRSIDVLAETDSSIVFYARYDYRLGDTTFSDTAYFGFSNGRLYCLAYAFNGEYCTLYGKQKR
jgi:hypothetical protein